MITCALQLPAWQVLAPCDTPQPKSVSTWQCTFDRAPETDRLTALWCVLQASADDKFADYKPTTAFFFPGQGAQSVGMAKVQPPAAAVAIRH